jgi:DNA-directed RNA polymerase subunit M/transcription elongation factor TFIIS
VSTATKLGIDPLVFSGTCPMCGNELPKYQIKSLSMKVSGLEITLYYECGKCSYKWNIYDCMPLKGDRNEE